LTFLFASPPPSGATLSSNGVFRWRPGAANAGTTNPILVRVCDNGVPSLSATQSFKVMVQDYVAPSLGLFIMRAGETGAVPVRVFSSAGLSSLSFTLLYPPTMLSDLGLRALAPQIATASLQELSPGAMRVQITNYAGQLLQGTQQVALLAFTALADHSAFVPVTITNIVATRANGTAVADTAVQSGRVIIIANEPLVEATMRTNNQRTVVVYGKPGASYRLESSAAFDPSQPWQTVSDLVLPDMSATFDVAPANGASFFRAREL
jgi:hypothetical protein